MYLSTHVSRGIDVFRSSERNKTLTRESELRKNTDSFQEEEEAVEEDRRRRVGRETSNGKWPIYIMLLPPPGPFYRVLEEKHV